MLERRFRHNTLLLCFTLIVCLSVWQLITGPGPPATYVLDEQSHFAPHLVSDANATYEYPMQALPAADYARLIDFDAFAFTILHTRCNDTAPLLLVLVHSAPKNFARRQTIRKTWGQKMHNVLVLFAFGKVDSVGLQQRLDDENNRYGDFIQGNFGDTYTNVTYKHAMIFKYAIYHCPSAKYVLKTDDDVFVNLYAYMEFLHHELSPFGARDLLFCNMRRTPPVNRSYRSKWRVKFSDYTDSYFPNMCPGWAVLYSPDVLFRIYTELQKASYFWIDDVLITGVLREQLNVSLVDSYDWILSMASLDEWDPAKSFLYGSADLSEANIRTMWNFTRQHVRGHFVYAFEERHNATSAEEH